MPDIPPPRRRTSSTARTSPRARPGLSVAFDLPTQTGYDPDHPLARGEVGKVGVPVSHLGDMRALFEGIPLASMNTSMTINATAAWLLALYIAVADEQGAPRGDLTGTIQNDIIKEYLSRGTYVFPPEPSMRLIKDIIVYTWREVPKWNPTNVCSYHLQEAGATPVQELAYALAIAQAVLDTVKASGEVSEADFPQVVGRISFFVNAGVRFITEMCKMRAFVDLWDEICLQALRRDGREAAPLPLRRAGQQPRPHRAAAGEQRLPHPAGNAGGGAVEKGARPRRAASGLERGARPAAPLGSAMVAAHAADRRLRDRPPGIRGYFRRLGGDRRQGRGAEAARRARSWSASTAWAARSRRSKSSYMKQRLVESNAARLRAIETGEQVVVGVNRWTETEPSPLSAGSDGGILTVPEWVEDEQVAQLQGLARRRAMPRPSRERSRELRAAAQEGRNIMEPSIACAKAGVTTGEWGETLRAVFGEYRAPTGVGKVRAETSEGIEQIRADVDRVSAQARPADQIPRRQAGPRRPFQRRRADRRARARLRHGSRL